MYSSSAGWRKYQEDRLSYMQLIPGQPPLCNSPVKSTTPSPASINMLFLSIFDGHGGSDTSEYCARHFHPFLRARVEERMLHWREQQLAASITGGIGISGGSRVHKRRHSFSEVATPLSSASSRTNSFSLSSAALPPHPIDNEFLAKVFLEFDAGIPLPPAESIPRNSPPSIGGFRRAPPTAPLGNNIPHLASGTTATVCIIDLANNHVVIAHIGDSRAVVFNSVKELAIEPPTAAATTTKTRMSPVSEEESAGATSSTEKGALKSRRSKGKSTSSQPTAAAPDALKSKDRSKLSRRRLSVTSSTPPSILTPSSNFIIQYHSRDHHPDDPIEQHRIQNGQFETTFLNHQPPSKSRICHTLQRISLNVVRGFGDAWFKLEPSAEQKDQMVCVVPDCWFAKFPMALPATPSGAAALDEQDAACIKRVTTTAPRAALTGAESPSNSRSTTPVLGPTASSSSRVALPPAGETLFIVLASDGIWNSEFPPNTPGVTIKHGSETAIRKEAREMKSLSAPVKQQTGPARPPRVHQPTLASSQGMPESDDEENESAAPPQQPVSDEEREWEEDEESDSSGWSSSSDEDEYPDMQVNLAVSQYFYNHAQPIINAQVEAMMKDGTQAATPAAAMTVAASATHAPSPAREKSHPIAGRRSSSAGATVTAPTSPAASAASSPPITGYSSLVSQSLDLLMAHPPLTKQNLKSTDNMSAWLISITPIGVNHQHTGVPTLHLQEEADYAQVAKPRADARVTSSLSSLPSPTSYRPGAGVGLGAAAAASPSAKSGAPIASVIVPDPVASNSNQATPADPAAAAATDASSMLSPPKLKAQRLTSVAPTPEWPSAATNIAASLDAAAAPNARTVCIPSGTVAASASSPSFVSFVRAASDVSSSAPTPFLGVTDGDDSPVPIASPSPIASSPRAPSITIVGVGVGARKRRRSTADVAEDAAATPTTTDQKQPDGDTPAVAPQRASSRSEAVADLLFSGNTMQDVDAALIATAQPTAPARVSARRTSMRSSPPPPGEPRRTAHVHPPSQTVPQTRVRRASLPDIAAPAAVTTAPTAPKAAVGRRGARLNTQSALAPITPTVGAPLKSGQTIAGGSSPTPPQPVVLPPIRDRERHASPAAARKRAKK